MLRKTMLQSHFISLTLIYTMTLAPLGHAAPNRNVKSKSKFAFVVETLTGVLGVFLVSGCGKAASSSISISGVAQMGRVANAEIKFYLASDTDFSDPIWTGETDATGNYSASIAPQAEPLVVDISGKPDGTSFFYDEADGTQTYLTDTESLKAVIPDPSVSGEYPVTPYTHTSYEIVKTQLGTDITSVSIENMRSYWQLGLRQTAEAYGISDYTALTAIPSDPSDANATMNAAAFAMGQYSKFLDQNGIAPGNAMVAVGLIATGFGNDGTLSTADMPVQYQGLATAFANGTTGFQAAAAAYAADPQCPASLGAVYTAAPTFFTTVDASPQGYVASGVDYTRMKVAAAASGTAFVDPCAAATLNTAACPKPEYIAAGNFSPATSDAFRATNNSNVTYGLPTGVPAYTGSGEGAYTFNAMPSATAYASGTYTPPAAPAAVTTLYAIGETPNGSSICTITIKKTDNVAPASVTGGYSVKQYVAGTGMTTIASGVSISSPSFTYTMPSSGMFQIEMVITTPSPQNIMASCYKM